MRDLLRGLAAEGRTVLISSHLMAETAQTAGHVIVIGRGKLVADLPIAELTRLVTRRHPIHVRSPHADRLQALLTGPDISVTRVDGQGILQVEGASAQHIGDLAASARHRPL